MSKAKAEGNKAVVEAGEFGVVGFETAKITECLTVIGGTIDNDKASKDERSAMSFRFCELANAFVVANHAADITDSTTLVDGFKAHLKTLRLPLSVAGSSLVKVGEAKKDKPAKITWTGYGRNVVSTVAGIVEFELDPNDLPDLDDDNSETAKVASYRQCQKVVVALREKLDRELNPHKYQLLDAIAAADETWKELRAMCVAESDVNVMTTLDDTLKEVIAEVKATQAEQAALAKKAAEAALADAA